MEEQYKSIFEYLKSPAGPNLGKEVFENAKEKGVKPIVKEVKTKNYEGKIMTYPLSFLENYFNPKPIVDNIEPIVDDLPF